MSRPPAPGSADSAREQECLESNAERCGGPSARSCSVWPRDTTRNKSKLYRSAKEAVDTALKYAFVGRRDKKRDFRRLWIIRINAAAREQGLTYGELIRGLKIAGVGLDRKSLADLAVDGSRPAFARIASQAKGALAAPAQ